MSRISFLDADRYSNALTVVKPSALYTLPVLRTRVDYLRRRIESIYYSPMFILSLCYEASAEELRDITLSRCLRLHQDPSIDHFHLKFHCPQIALVVLTASAYRCSCSPSAGVAQGNQTVTLSPTVQLALIKSKRDTRESKWKSIYQSNLTNEFISKRCFFHVFIGCSLL